MIFYNLGTKSYVDDSLPPEIQNIRWLYLITWNGSHTVMISYQTYLDAILSPGMPAICWCYVITWDVTHMLTISYHLECLHSLMLCYYLEFQPYVDNIPSTEMLTLRLLYPVNRFQPQLWHLHKQYQQIQYSLFPSVTYGVSLCRYNRIIIINSHNHNFINATFFVQ